MNAQKSPPSTNRLQRKTPTLQPGSSWKRWLGVVQHQLKMWKRPGGFVEQMQFDRFMQTLSTLTTQQLSDTLQQYPWLGSVQGQRDGRSALMQLAEAGDVDKLLLLLPLSRANALDHNRNNALRWALAGAERRQLRQRLSKNSNAPAPLLGEDAAALNCASVLEPHTNLNIVDTSGETLLFSAARQNAVGFLLLLRPYTDVTLRGRDGQTALSKAAMHASWGCVQALADTVSAKELGELLTVAQSVHKYSLEGRQEGRLRLEFAERCQALVERKTMQEALGATGTGLVSEPLSGPQKAKGMELTYSSPGSSQAVASITPAETSASPGLEACSISESSPKPSIEVLPQRGQAKAPRRL